MKDDETKAKYTKRVLKSEYMRNEKEHCCCLSLRSYSTELNKTKAQGKGRAFEVGIVRQVRYHSVRVTDTRKDAMLKGKS